MNATASSVADRREAAPSAARAFAAAAGALVAVSGIVAGCTSQAPGGANLPVRVAQAAPAAPSAATAIARPAPNPLMNAYFGDLHVHTRDSLDAYIFNTRATPDDAYRYAKGGTIRHPGGFDLKLGGPALDFLAVTDHAEYLGAGVLIDTPGSPLSDYAQQLLVSKPSAVGGAFARFVQLAYAGTFANLSSIRPVWAQSADAARRAYEPGRFTSFAAYEYTSAPGGHNLHRNVIFATDAVPELPFTAVNSQDPEDLWRWLDRLRAIGVEALAIPHNSNGSDGWMFERTTRYGQPIDRDYALRRARNEPLVEVTQYKGTSETHPLLSPNDEFASFEINERFVGSGRTVTTFDGGYVRKALRDGLALEADTGANPFKLGFVGGSDSHNGAGSYEERGFQGHHGLADGAPERRGSVPPPGARADPSAPARPVGRPDFGSAGLTGVWAEENTRESIYAAFRRRETFATSGTRIRVRFFGGYGLDALDLRGDAGVRAAYANGVPMGSDLAGRGDRAPTFLVAAMRDVRGAPLQRLQIVKGWTEPSGATREQIFDVGCSDGGRVDARTRRCPDNGASVDPSSCAPSADRGAGELFARWTDPEFDPARPAFYYARVLENPTCRWSTWDALRAGTTPSPRVPKTIQERAYTSPIWFIPARGG